MPAAHTRLRHASLLLLHCGYDLLFAEPAALHRPTPKMGRTPPKISKKLRVSGRGSMTGLGQPNQANKAFGQHDGPAKADDVAHVGIPGA